MYYDIFSIQTWENYSLLDVLFNSKKHIFKMIKVLVYH